jgi:hypothetical protein
MCPKRRRCPAIHPAEVERTGCFVTNWFGLDACDGVATALPPADDVEGRIDALAAAVVALARSVDAVLARLDAGSDATAVVIRGLDTAGRCRRTAG